MPEAIAASWSAWSTDSSGVRHSLRPSRDSTSACRVPGVRSSRLSSSQVSFSSAVVGAGHDVVSPSGCGVAVGDWCWRAAWSSACGAGVVSAGWRAVGSARPACGRRRLAGPLAGRGAGRGAWASGRMRALDGGRSGFVPRPPGGAAEAGALALASSAVRGSRAVRPVASGRRVGVGEGAAPAALGEAAGRAAALRRPWVGTGSGSVRGGAGGGVRGTGARGRDGGRSGHGRRVRRGRGRRARRRIRNGRGRGGRCRGRLRPCGCGRGCGSGAGETAVPGSDRMSCGMSIRTPVPPRADGRKETFRPCLRARRPTTARPSRVPERPPRSVASPDDGAFGAAQLHVAHDQAAVLDGDDDAGRHLLDVHVDLGGRRREVRGVVEEFGERVHDALGGVPGDGGLAGGVERARAGRRRCGPSRRAGSTP